jgi:hypothetical protein
VTAVTNICAQFVLQIGARVVLVARAPFLKTILLLSLTVSSWLGQALASYQAPASMSPKSWTSHNRFVEVFWGQRHQNYREVDTQGLTSTGTLNTETGAHSHRGIAMRWQSDIGFMVHLQTQRQRGATNYDGYLQSGGMSLTPYRARTGNTATQVNLDCGYAFNASNWPALPPNWQITPLVRLGQHRWKRNLVQYSEAYRYNTHAAGALVQWQVMPGSFLALQALLGRTQAAKVSAPTLSFSAEQPSGNFREWQLGVSQDLASLTGKEEFEGWLATARFTASQYAHGVSAVVSSLQAPPNRHKPSVWMLGVQRLF